MELNFKSFGSGTPVVILHGLFGSLDNWQTFARKLSSDYLVYSLDLRNHGKSPHSETHTYEAMANDVADFFDVQKIDKAHVIGHSMGGKAAMQFALLHPEKILQLIVVDIAPRAYERGHDGIFEALMEMDFSGITKREDADAQLAGKIQNPAVRQFLLKNLERQDDGSFQWKMNLPVLFENYDHINSAIQSTQPVEVPLTVIRGGRSDYVQDSDEQSFKAIFPSTNIITIQSAGHWVHAEEPEEFFNAVNEVIAEK